MDLFDKPEMFMEAGEILVDKAIAFAREQIKAGADMIGIGDAAASLIGPDLYSQFVLPLETKLIAGIHNAGATVKLHICGNVTPTLVHMAKTGADIIDCDWMVALDKVLVQGTPQTVAAAARDCFQKAGDPFILMPGCEVSPLTPESNIRAFCPCQGCQIPDILKC
jgi:uroporphyrinogen-III decarboxylase